MTDFDANTFSISDPRVTVEDGKVDALADMFTGPDGVIETPKVIFEGGYYEIEITASDDTLEIRRVYDD